MSLTCLNLLANSPQQGSVAAENAPNILKPREGTVRYPFVIQTNHCCHLLAWENLKRVEEMRARNGAGQVEFQACDMRTRRQWFGYEGRIIQIWKKSFLGALDEANDGSALREFFSEWAEKGPVLPHVYNHKGQKVWRRRLGSIEGGVKKVLSTPSLLMDYDALAEKKLYIGGIIPLPVDKGLPQLDTLLPIVEANGACYAFNEDTWAYEKQEGGQIDGLPGVPHSVLGFDKVACEEGKGFQITAHDGVGLVPCWLGMHKLMLLGLGVDEQNDSLVEGHPHWSAHVELRELMDRDPDNPWRSDGFSSERYYPQAIASLLVEDEDLKQQMEAVVDIYVPMYQRYSQLLDGGKFFNVDGQEFNQESLGPMFPSREQVLGYFWSQSLWFLLVGGLSRAFFEGQMLGVRAPPALTGIVGMSFNDCMKRASRNRVVGDTKVDFFAVLHRLHQKLREKYPERLEWVAFGGHAYVLSLDPELLARQLECPVAYPDVIEKLGVTLIDSLAIPGISDWFKEPAQGLPA